MGRLIEYFLSWIIVGLIFVNIVLFTINNDVAAADKQTIGQNFLELELHNPYRFAVELEVKCDWSHKKQQFDFVMKYMIKPDKKLNIMFPKYYSKCQVWPDHAWFFVNGKEK